MVVITQPRSQGLSPLPPLSLKRKGGKGERPSGTRVAREHRPVIFSNASPLPRGVGVGLSGSKGEVIHGGG